MKRFLRLEWQTIKEKKSHLKTLGYLLFYYAVFFFLIGQQKLGASFFPTMATLSSVALFISLFEEGKEVPMRRLLPSLPFTRREIFQGRTIVKLIVWFGGMLVAFLLSWLLDPIMDSKPTLAVSLIGFGFSLFLLSLENWSIQLPHRMGVAIRAGLLGGLMGLLIGSGGAVFQTITQLDPTGMYVGLGGIVLAIVSLWLNQRVYQRRAL